MHRELFKLTRVSSVPDKCCAEHTTPLLESGTLSTKCNGDVFLPFRTKTYNDSVEEEDGNQIAMCTLKGAPYL